MSGLIVGGTVRFAPGEIERLAPHMKAVIEGTRGEAGCLHYSYSRLLEDPDVIVIFERWESGPALSAHFKTAHMAAWYDQLSTAKVLSREINVYPFETARPTSDYRDA